MFPGIVGYEDTVVPQIVNACCRGITLSCSACADRRRAASCARSRPCWTNTRRTSRAAKSTTIHTTRFAVGAATLVAREGDATPIAYLSRDDRYVEKLATPDVTIADLIGDIDPIKAARGGHELSE